MSAYYIGHIVDAFVCKWKTAFFLNFALKPISRLIENGLTWNMNPNTNIFRCKPFNVLCTWHHKTAPIAWNSCRRSPITLISLTQRAIIIKAK